MLARSLAIAGFRIGSPRLSLVRLILIIGFANFTAIAALIEVRLPFTPVPITAQTLAVLLAGICLGARGGALAQLAYIGEGLIGLPVFAGGKAGIAYFLGPTGGYLVGFVVAAFVVGWLAERGWARNRLPLLATLFVGNVAIYLCGVTWLAQFLPGGLASAFAAGVLPFLIGDTIKMLLAAVVVPSARHLIRPSRR
jgi:biotin transport system substrate-specific component